MSGFSPSFMFHRVQPRGLATISTTKRPLACRFCSKILRGLNHAQQLHHNMCLPLKKGRFVRATALRSIISIIMDLCDSQKKIPAAMATVGEVATIEPQLPQLDVVHGPKECKECKELQTAEAELIRWIPEVCKW